MLLSLSGRLQRELYKVAGSIQGTKEDKAELAAVPRLTTKIGIKQSEKEEGGATGAREMLNRLACSEEIRYEEMIKRGSM